MSDATGYTLAEARTRVLRDYMDDANGVRWGSALVDDALQSSLTRIMDEYIAETGGDRFMLEVAVTSTSAGVIDLSALTEPAHVVRKIAVKTTESVRQNVFGIRPEDFQQADTKARDLLLYYVPAYSIPATTTHPLVGVTSTRAPGTWRAFEDLVILDAAYHLRLRDPKSRPPPYLREALDDARRRVMSLPTTPRARRFPSKKAWFPNLYWHWLPNAEEVQLSTRW